MDALYAATRKAIENHSALPFSMYSSVAEQTLINVPVARPILIALLKGEKHLGKSSEHICGTGDFVFLSNHVNVDMRNIPGDQEYAALIIDFDFADFTKIDKESIALTKGREGGEKGHISGPIDSVLKTALLQFVEWSSLAPSSLWPSRRQELLQLLVQSGYPEVLSIKQPQELSLKVQSYVQQNLNCDFSVSDMCDLIGMSESTLRRRLAQEGASVQEIRDQIRMGTALHLLQTTTFDVARVASECGYQSQSRFTERFKKQFGTTPSELRKTRMID